MNEFVVWDKDRRVWIDESYPFYINSTGLLCIQRNNKVMMIENDCEVFNYTGKDDIDGNKIYADCSIVEFEYKEKFNSEIKKLKGFFIWDNTNLLYYIEVLGVFGRRPMINYKGLKIKNLKIIGTLQENKELLDV